MAHSLSCLALTGAMALATTSAASAVLVLDTVVLGETRIDGEKVGEFSALVQTADGEILGISDRGYIAQIAVEITGDRLTRLEPLALHLLTGPDGTLLHEQDFNPEGAAMLDDGSIAIVSESGPRLAVFDRIGRWLRDEPLPEALRDAANQAGPKDGIEALAWTAATGFVAMTEEPALGQNRNDHALHSTLAGSGAMVAAGTESVSIKGMEVAGPQLFILERTRDDLTDTLHPFLRTLDLAACLAGTCDSQTQPILVDGITDADFEGLAALGDGRFLMVSDDKVDGDLRSVFVLFRLE